MPPPGPETPVSPTPSAPPSIHPPPIFPCAHTFPVSKNLFSSTLKPPHKTFIDFFHFLPLSHSCVLPPHPPFPHHGLRPPSPAGWPPSTSSHENHIPKAHHLIFLGSPLPHPHSPQPSKNLDHPSPGPSFSLGNISRFILSLSFPCQGAGESLFICSPPALLSPILVHSHHVSLYKHSCHVTSSSSGSQGRPGLGSGKGSTYMESESVSAPAGRTAWPGLLTFLKLLSLESECTYR